MKGRFGAENEASETQGGAGRKPVAAGVAPIQFLWGPPVASDGPPDGACAGSDRRGRAHHLTRHER